MTCPSRAWHSSTVILPMCIPLFCFVLIFRLRLHDRVPGLRLLSRLLLWGSSLEPSDREESGGSDLWPTDLCAIRRQPELAMPTENPQRGFADLDRSNLWRSMVVARTRGSNRVQAQPAGSQRDQWSLRCLSYACVAWPLRQQVEPGTARPLTLSSAVPWVRSEKDTSPSSQFLVAERRLGASN